MGTLSPSSPLRNPIHVSDHQTPPPSPPPPPHSQPSPPPHSPPSPPPPPHSQPSPPPYAPWSFDQSWGSIETATHLSPIPTYSWEETDTFSVVVPETEFSVSPTLSPILTLSPSADFSCDSTFESSGADLSPNCTVVPETQPTEGRGGYTEKEKQYLRFLAIQCPCVLLLL